jgi:hypothetical protein
MTEVHTKQQWMAATRKTRAAQEQTTSKHPVVTPKQICKRSAEFSNVVSHKTTMDGGNKENKGRARKKQHINTQW